MVKIGNTDFKHLVLLPKSNKEYPTIQLTKHGTPTRLEEVWKKHGPTEHTKTGGTVGKEYTASLDFNELDLSDLNTISIKGLEKFGLEYNSEENIISGIEIVYRYPELRIENRKPP